MNLNKFLAVFIGATFGITLATGYAVYQVVRKADRDIQTLDVKFGTAPTHPQYDPIVHLANERGLSLLYGVCR